MKLVILATLSLIFVLGWYSWSMGKLRLMQTWPYGSDLLAISPDGKLLAAPGGPLQKRKIGIKYFTENTTVKLHTFPDGEVVRTLDAFYVTSLTFSRDNSLIAAGTGLGEIFIWRTDDGQLLHSLKATKIEPQISRVNTLIFSRDGQTLVTGIAGQIDVWRVADGQLRYSLSNGNNFSGAFLSPDGQILAHGGVRTTITLYRLSDGTLLRQLEVNGYPRFSSDGQLLAISYSNSYDDSWEKVLLYRLEDDTFLGVLPGLEKHTLDLTFSPDGRYLAATYQTGGGGTGIMIAPDFSPPKRWHLVLWRLDDLSSKYFIPRVIQSQKESFTTLAFSPDRILVSGGDAIRLWRVPD